LAFEMIVSRGCARAQEKKRTLTLVLFLFSDRMASCER
jgi:hypothetical protein